MNKEYTIIEKPAPRPRPDYYIKVPAIKAQMKSRWSTVNSDDLLEYIHHMYNEMNVEIPNDPNGEYIYLPKCIKTGIMFYLEKLPEVKTTAYSVFLKDSDEFELVPVKVNS